MYDFVCDVCNTTYEKLFKSSDLPDVIECETDNCEGHPSRCPSFYYTSPLSAQRFAPIIVHQDSQGNFRLPAHSDAPVPEGFEKVRLTDFHQVRKFEKVMNDRENAQAKEHFNNKVQSLSHTIKSNREGMRDIVSKFSPRGKRFYESMQKASDQKLHSMANRSVPDSNFHVEALSQDSSNRDKYRDAMNDWGKYGAGRK